MTQLLNKTAVWLKPSVEGMDLSEEYCTASYHGDGWAHGQALEELASAISSLAKRVECRQSSSTKCYAESVELICQIRESLYDLMNGGFRNEGLIDNFITPALSLIEASLLALATDQVVPVTFRTDSNRIEANHVTCESVNIFDVERDIHEYRLTENASPHSSLPAGVQ